MNFSYLASPYTHPDPQVRVKRFEDACRAAAALMTEGKIIFSPIAHSNSIETIGLGAVKTGAFWKQQDTPFLLCADELIVLMLDGWESSAGIAWEMQTARELGIPISWVKL